MDTDVLTHTPPPENNRLIPVLIVLCIVFISVSGFLFYKIASRSPVVDTAVNDASLPTVKNLTVPAGAIKISGCIPHEGEHWVEIDKLPHGPYYVAHNGIVTALDYMLTEDDIPGKDFAHKSLPEELEYMQANNMDLSDLVHHLDKEYAVPPGVTVKSWSIHWTPPHGGLIVPHYDMHLYLVDNTVLESICPDAPMDSVLPQEVYDELQRLGVPVPQMGEPAPPAQSTPSAASPAIRKNE